MFKKYFGLWTLLAVVWALFFPKIAGVFTPYTTWLLIAMMFFSCLKMDAKDILKKTRKNYKRYLLISAVIFFLPTLLAYFSRSFLDPITFVGLLFVAAAPAGVASVMVVDILGGDASEALMVVTLTHIFGPILTPAAVWIFGHAVVSIPFASIAGIMLKLIIIPFILAQIARQIGVHKKFENTAANLNMIFFTLIMIGLMAPAAPLIFGAPFKAFIISAAILTISIIIGSLAVWYAKVTKTSAVTLTVLTVFKNFSVIAIAATPLFGPAGVLPAVVYGVFNSVVLAVLQFLVNKKYLKN